MSDEYVVYGLEDPRDHLYHYIGITNDVYARFNQHVTGDGGNIKKNGWIFECRQANLMIVMRELERVHSQEQAEQRERFWIRYYLWAGYPLTNSAGVTPILEEKIRIENSHSALLKEKAQIEKAHREVLEQKSALEERVRRMERERLFLTAGTAPRQEQSATKPAYTPPIALKVKIGSVIALLHSLSFLIAFEYTHTEAFAVLFVVLLSIATILMSGGYSKSKLSKASR